MPLYLLNDDDVRFIKSLRQWQMNLRGRGVRSNSKDGATIDLSSEPAPKIGVEEFKRQYFRVTGTATGSLLNRWIYSVEEVSKNGVGYGTEGWNTLDDGVSGDIGYNFRENDSLYANLQFIPISTNTIVPADVVNTANGVEVWFNEYPSPYRTFKVTGSSSLGNNQWSYTVDEVYKSGTGYGGWASRPSGGYVGVTATYNMTENMNAATGIQGNGVSVANLLGTFAHQKIPTGEIVEGKIVYVSATEYEIWLMNMPISVDGACS